MHLPQVSKPVFYRKVFNSDENVLMNLVILWEKFLSDIKSYLIQDWKHESGLFSYPNSKRRILGTKLSETHFQTLLIISTHLIDPLLIDILILFIMVASEKLAKYLSNPLDSFRSLNPSREFSSYILKIKDVTLSTVVLALNLS